MQVVNNSVQGGHPGNIAPAYVLVLCGHSESVLSTWQRKLLEV